MRKEQKKYIKGFTWSKRAWYCEYPDQEKTIYFGLYDEESECIGEMVMMWDDSESDSPASHLKVGKDGWKLLSNFSSLFDIIASREDGPTQEEFVDILRSLGFKDRTEYVDPEGSRMNHKKSLGQIAYESPLNGGPQNWGPWEKAPQLIRDVHEDLALTVAKEVLRRRGDAEEKRYESRGGNRND